MPAKATLPLLKQAASEWSEDKSSRLAAALAYYTAMSIAPLLVLAVTFLGWMQLNGRQVVESQMGQLMGDVGQQAAVTMIDAAKKQSGTLATAISLLILVISASGMFGELQDSMNTIWEVKPRPNMGWIDTIKKRFFSLTMVFGVIFLMLVSMVISTILSAMVAHFAGEGKIAGLILDVVLSLIVYTGVFMLLFKYLPDVKIRFADVWLGAIFTAALFTIGKYLLTLYLTKGSTASAYGAAGSLAALLIWVYYSAQILFFGGEFTQVYAKKYAHRIVLDKDAVPVTDEERAQHGMPRKEDLQESASAQAKGASQRGGLYVAGSPSAAAPRVVTITQPAPEAAKAYAFAGLGLAAGFVVGAAGLLAGRKYTAGGLEQMRLNERLARLESKYGRGKTLRVQARQLELTERLDRIESRVRQATDSLRRRSKAYAKPKWMDRLAQHVTGN